MDVTVCTLASASTGKVYRICEIRPSALASLLGEMGIHTGQEIRVLARAPWSGPVAIQTRELRFSLRPEEAVGILLEVQAGNQL